MSLINEALKKAQRQRSLDSAPLSAAPSGVAAAAVTTHVRAATHRRSNAPIWFGLGLLVLGVASTVLIMRFGFAPTTPAPAAVATAAQPTQPAPPPAPVAYVAPSNPVVTANVPSVEPQVTLPPVTYPAPSGTTPPAPAATPAPVVATPVHLAPALRPVVVVPAPATIPPPTPVAPVSVAGPPASHEAEIQTFLSGARLTGVRGVERQARVLMNEKVFRLNDMVSPELGLRLSAVRSGLLVFTDAQGKTYEKSY